MDTSGFALFNAVAAAMKTVYELAQGTANLEMKQQLNAVYDTLMSLKQTAAELEEENRKLKARVAEAQEKLTLTGVVFRRGGFVFREGDPDACCSKCWDAEHKLIHIDNFSIPPIASRCPQCKSQFTQYPPKNPKLGQ